MNLNQLRYVKAVAETGSFTLAAEQCYVTQPTLSNGIAQLEQEFEQRLFTRTTRVVSLTPFGEQILPLIHKMLAAQAELLREARNFVHPSQHVIRIGSSPLIKADWLVALIEDFRKIHPHIEIILHEQNMEDLYRMLDEGLVDFVFGVAGSRKSSWKSAFLYREPLYFLPRSTHFPKGEKTVTLNEISAETFVMVPNVCGLARATRALFRKHRRRLNEYPGEALSYQVLEEWATLGLGAAILPESKLQSAQNKAYALIDKKGDQITLEFDAVWPGSTQRQTHLLDFAEFLNHSPHNPR